ncbi:MAG: hypothetical protein ACRDKW_01885 [Actinomycetota bacterium]
MSVGYDVIVLAPVQVARAAFEVSTQPLRLTAARVRRSDAHTTT